MTSCEQIRQLVTEQLGIGTLSAEVISHLSTCTDCRAFADEMTMLGHQLASIEPESLTSAEKKNIEHAVMTHITDEVAPVLVRFSWSRLGLSAAALLLVASIGITGWWLGSRRTGQGSTSSPVSVLTSESDDQYDESYQPDPLLVSLLLEDLSGGDLSVAVDSLTTGLSDEEYEYLQSSLKENDFL